MINYNGRLIGVSTSSNFVKKQDFQEPYSYCGVAAIGTSESSNGWTITRIEVFTDGTINSMIATSVAWVDRYTTTYN